MLSNIRSGILFGIYSDILCDMGTAHCHLALAVEELRDEEKRRTLMKSRGPQLVGGEKIEKIQF